MTVAVITSIYGNYDGLKEPAAQTVDCEFICVTDLGRSSEAWEMVVEPRPHLVPRMAAKVPKCCPHFYTEAPISIWVDASARIVDHDFVDMCVTALGENSIAQWVHPERDCIYDEVCASREFAKYESQPMGLQADRYWARGYPPNGGLWAAGVVVRRNTDHIRQFGYRWLAEQCRYSYQDQISEPPLLAAFELVPAPLPESLWANRWLQWERHRDDR